MRLSGCNTSSEGHCRTLKANYYKVSLANLIHKGGMGATGVIEIYETDIIRLLKG